MFVVVLFSNMTRHPALWLVLMWVVGGSEPVTIQRKVLANQFAGALRLGSRERTRTS